MYRLAPIARVYRSHGRHGPRYGLDVHQERTIARPGVAGVRRIIMVDGNIRFQQNLDLIAIPIILLQARTNRLADLRPLVGAAALTFGNLPRLTVIPS